MPNQSRIIIALDFPDARSALKLAEQLDPKLCQLKVGKELFTRCGPDIVSQLIKRDFKIFLDLKYHDIPNTVAQACRAAADLGVWMLNVHASGGLNMLTAAKDALSHYQHQPLLIAVTVLTSMTSDDLPQIGYRNITADLLTYQLAELTKSAGLDGIVCAAPEVSAIKQKLGSDFITVTPGIRLGEDDKDDQKRTMTPAEAIAAGTDYLVIGRSITKAKLPLVKLEQILAEITPSREVPE